MPPPPTQGVQVNKEIFTRAGVSDGLPVQVCVHVEGEPLLSYVLRRYLVYVYLVTELAIEQFLSKYIADRQLQIKSR